MAATCWSCGEGAVVADLDSGVLVCDSCGRIHDAGASEFVDQTVFTGEGRPDTRFSSFVHHRSGESPYREQKLAAASADITSIAARLGLSPPSVEEALRMAKSATAGNLAIPGSAFLPALAAACSLLVARSHRIPLSLAEAAAAAYCPTVSLADLASRIASHLALPPVPAFDYDAALDRAVRLSSSLPAVAGDERTEVILSQARFLLRCVSKWSLTTGRHPLPLIASLVTFAAKVNGVTSVSLEEIAQAISAGLRTTLIRYKELVDVLVCVARELLPWGADVNAKNLLLNAPMLLRLMEMRSQSDPSERFLESFAPDIAGIVKAYSSADEDESKYLQIAPLGVDDLDTNNSGKARKGSEDLKISEVCLSDAYQNVLKRLAQLQRPGTIGKSANKRKQWRRGLELEPWMDLLHDGSTNDQEVLDIEIGYDAPPPSFSAGIELQKQRRARIESAKGRIDAIRKAPDANTNDSQAVLRSEDVCPPPKLFVKKQGKKGINGGDHITRENHPAETQGDGKRKRKRGHCDVIDWEDCVIELLLLHGASEKEIEQGHYRRLLELHVFSPISGGR